ncbi:polysaccharide lyase 6 family protein [Pedobacter arcticus]|uniref:polysaccharide lyase 6 family protein n=1 Tax=Pedobacter arcticus TaxID=752140 RepID=UPI00030B458B|nr:polysaccharide lyase 6 family protein [Pedobacter arcticus]
MRQFLKNTKLTALGMLFVIGANAKDYRVASAQEISALKLVPGDKVIMKAGDWKNQQIVFRGKGTAQQPITLTTENPGKVVSSGNSTLKIDGDYLIVDGLAFADGYSEKDAVVTFTKTSNNCRLTNSSIIDYNHPDKDFHYTWVSLFGTRGQVDHCAFSGKAHQEPVLVVWLSDKPNYTQIDHNYFGPRPDLKANGGEIIRIGTSEWSMHDSYATVENNIFDSCNGETETVSIKSCYNKVLNNLFYECVGTLTFRHGNNSEASNNYFIGNYIKNTGGIRVIGENHKVYNNYLYGIKGTGLRAAISLMNAYKNPELIKYWQVKNAVITDNVIVNCAVAIEIGSGKDSIRVMPPIGVILEENIVVNTPKLIVYNEKLENSIVKNNKEKGTDLIAGFESLKEDLVKSDGIYQVRGKEKTPFWMIEKIGPNWRKENFEVQVK